MFLVLTAERIPAVAFVRIWSFVYPSEFGADLAKLWRVNFYLYHAELPHQQIDSFIKLTIKSGCTLFDARNAIGPGMDSIQFKPPTEWSEEWQNLLQSAESRRFLMR